MVLTVLKAYSAAWRADTKDRSEGGWEGRGVR